MRTAASEARSRRVAGQNTGYRIRIGHAGLGCSRTLHIEWACRIFLTFDAVRTAEPTGDDIVKLLHGVTPLSCRVNAGHGHPHSLANGFVFRHGSEQHAAFLGMRTVSRSSFYVAQYPLR